MSNDLSRYYEVLELDPGASQEEVKKAYRDLARMHPDRFAHDPRMALRRLQSIPNDKINADFCFSVPAATEGDFEPRRAVKDRLLRCMEARQVYVNDSCRPWAHSPPPIPLSIHLTRTSSD